MGFPRMEQIAEEHDRLRCKVVDQPIEAGQVVGRRALRHRAHRARGTCGLAEVRIGDHEPAPLLQNAARCASSIQASSPSLTATARRPAPASRHRSLTAA